MWITWIAIGVIVLIFTGVIIKIVRDKRKDVKCIGCFAKHGCAYYEKASCDNCTYHTDDE